MCLINRIVLFAFAATVLDSVIVNAADLQWTCESSVPDRPINVTRMSGSWFEVARVPAADVAACVEVIAPDSIENDNYTLTVDYYNNVNNGWVHTINNVSFPANVTDNGKFELEYGTGVLALKITFKIIVTDYNNIALVCGYTGFSSASLLKVMARNRTVPNVLKEEVQNLINAANLTADITWVEQSAKCTGSTFIPIIWLMGIMIVLSTRKNLH